MSEVFAAVLIVASFASTALVTAVWQLDRRAWARERADLMNRWMARDYGEFKRHEPKPVPVAVPTLTESQEKALAQIERDFDEAHGLV